MSFNNGLPGTLQEASWPWAALGELPGKEEPLGGLARKVTLPLAHSQALPGMGYHMAHAWDAWFLAAVKKHPAEQASHLPLAQQEEC